MWDGRTDGRKARRTDSMTANVTIFPAAFSKRWYNEQQKLNFTVLKELHLIQ